MTKKNNYVKYDAVKEQIEKTDEIKLIVAKEICVNQQESKYAYLYQIGDVCDYKILKENLNLYEMLQFNKPLKPYIDFDFKIENIDEVNKEELLNFVLDNYKQAYKKCFNILLKKSEFVIIDGSRINKISFHIIINNNTFFKTNDEQKKFMQYFKSLELKFNNINLNALVDFLVYTKNRLFRLPNQCKLKYNECPLKIKSDHKLKDCLIIDYFNNCNDSNILNINNILMKEAGYYADYPNEKKEVKKLIDKPLENFNYISNNSGADLDIILNCIPAEYFETYGEWFKMANAVFNVGAEFYEIFDKHCRKYKEYDETRNLQDFNKFYKYNYRYKWSYLNSIVDKSKMQEFLKNKLLEDYKKFINPNITNNIKTINDESEFINKQLLFDAIEKFIILYAKPGKGKTQAIKSLIYYLNGVKEQNEEEQKLNKIELENKINKYKNIIKDFREQYILNKMADGYMFNNENNYLDDEYYSKLNVLKKKLKKYEDDYKKCNLNILILSTRIAFSKHMQKEFEINNYLEVENLSFYKGSIVISVESIYKLNFNNHYDIIILDECESVLNQLSSVTVKNKNECFKKLNHFINNASKIILADAFLTERTLKYLNNFNESKLLIKNDVFKNEKKAIVYNDEKLLKNKLFDDLKNGLKIYCHVTHKTKGITIIEELLKENILNENEIKFYSSLESRSEHEEKTNIELLLNINTEWKKYKLIMATSSITVGNSYENKDIDNVYIFGGCDDCGGCVVRDSFQNHYRIRHNQGNLYCFIPDGKPNLEPYILNYIDNENEINNQLKFMQRITYYKTMFTKEELNILLKNGFDFTDILIKSELINYINFDLEKEINKRNPFNLCKSRNEYQEFIKQSSKNISDAMDKYNDAIKYFEENNKYFSMSLDEIDKLNKYERMVNINIYKSVFNIFLIDMGYNIEYNTTLDKSKAIKTINSNTLYDDINNISQCKLNELKIKEEKSNITRKEKEMKHKAFFKLQYFKEQPDEVDNAKMEQIYNNIYIKEDKKKQFENFILEYCYNNNPEKSKIDFNNHFENVKNDQTQMSKTYNKFYEILELNKALGFKNSYEENIITPDDLNNRFSEYIKMNGKINKLKILFPDVKPYNINNIDVVKYNRTFISNLYTSFNGSKIINNEIKHTKKETTAINFKIQNIFDKSVDIEFLSDGKFNFNNLFKITLPKKKQEIIQI